MNTVSASKNLGLHLAVWIPLFGTILALILWIYFGVSQLSVWLFLSFVLMSQFGITVGYHRLFTHHSFETTRPIKILLAIMGSMTLEGPIFVWCARHRAHHQFTDKAGDPHSPLDGWFHSHVGFLWTEKDPDNKYIGDLLKDPDMEFVNQHFVGWSILSLLLPPILAWLFRRSLVEAFYGFLWGSLMRIFIVHHVTWSINSICHIWGSRPFNTGDESRNNILFAFIGFGEGSHNSHHAFQWSARHGLRWYQLDLGYWIIRLLQCLHLAWNVRTPTKIQIDSRKK